jgi:hypothetical protein
VAISGLRLLPPAFTWPALMKMGGRLAKLLTMTKKKTIEK